MYKGIINCNMPKDILKSCITVYKNTSYVHVPYEVLSVSCAIFRKGCISNRSDLGVVCYRYLSMYPEVLAIVYRDVNS